MGEHCRGVSEPRHIVIGPTTFIGEPYDLCPACGAAEGLGLLMVGRDRYIKRCRTCLREQMFDLPPAPTPQVLYLDQLAVSNLASSLLPSKRERYMSDDPVTQSGFWPRLFDRLDRLVALGLLVCPGSSVHRAEGLMDDRITGSLERVHQHLSGEARFVDHRRVKRDQLYLAFCGWLDDISEPQTLGRWDVVRDAGQWRDRLAVTARLEVDAREIGALREERDAAVPKLQEIVEEWATQEGRSFKARWDEQLASFGPGLLPLGPLGDTRILLVHAMKDRSVPIDKWQTTIEAFLYSEEIKRTPFAQLGCGLFAALGWQAERGQGKSVDRGMRNDFQAIAVYAPYCDAMLIDRRCRQLLTDTPLRDVVPTDLGVFDVRAREALEAWLDDVEAGAPTGHEALVRRVYGDGWLEPYRTLLTPQSGDRDL